MSTILPGSTHQGQSDHVSQPRHDYRKCRIELLRTYLTPRYPQANHDRDRIRVILHTLIHHASPEHAQCRSSVQHRDMVTILPYDKRACKQEDAKPLLRVAEKLSTIHLLSGACLIDDDDEDADDDSDSGDDETTRPVDHQYSPSQCVFSRDS